MEIHVHPRTANHNARFINSGIQIFYAAMLIALAVSLILQCIGLVTPGWLVLDFNVVGQELKFSMGLWYVNYCSKGTCETDNLDVFWKDHYTGPNRLIHNEMKEYQVETVLAAIFTTISMACIIKVLCCSPNGIYNNVNRNVWRVASACSALAGILAIVAAARYGQSIQEAHEDNSDPGPSPFKEPWSLMITGVGGVLAAVICIVELVETIRVSSRIIAAEPPRTQNNDFFTIRSSSPYPAGPAVTPRQVLEYDRNRGIKIWKTKY